MNVSFRKNQKIVLIRMDRIGDLVLTLPIDQMEPLKSAECIWFITKGLEFIPDSSIPKRTYFSWTRQFSWQQFLQMRQTLQKIKPDVSISIHVPWWVNAVLWLTGVPLRIGVLSQWHSYLFLNRGLRQKRSEARFHEMEYNAQLVKNAFAENSSSPTPLKLQALNPLTENLRHLIPDNYIVVHPGMGGSALNWPMESYAQLIEHLSSKIPVIITGTATDSHILNPLQMRLQKTKNCLWMNEKLKPTELLTVLSKAKAVVAPSTGVVHLAASLGVPTIGLYSPIRVEAPTRWAPLGANVKVFCPPLERENCMSEIAWEDVFNFINLI